MDDDTYQVCVRGPPHIEMWKKKQTKTRRKSMSEMKKTVAVLLTCILAVAFVPTTGMKSEAAHKHVWAYISTQKATCLTSGTTTYACKSCKMEKHVLSPALGHSYKITFKRVPTCTKNGQTTSVCTRCGKKKSSTTKAYGHKTSGYAYKKYGVYWRKCSRCDQEVRSNP